MCITVCTCLKRFEVLAANRMNNETMQPILFGRQNVVCLPVNLMYWVKVFRETKLLTWISSRICDEGSEMSCYYVLQREKVHCKNLRLWGHEPEFWGLFVVIQLSYDVAI